MDMRTSSMGRLSQFLQRHLLGLILLSYALAVVGPAPGLWMKTTKLVDVSLGAGRIVVSVPALLLGFLLFNAGLRARGEQVCHIAHRPGVVLAGLVANLAIPLLYLRVIMLAMRSWHNADEARTILIGLALVAAMPVAGSSTGWVQTSGGDMALSLALVLTSTLLSPLTTPLALQLVGAASPAGFADELRLLAGRNTGAFLALWVLLPCLLGILARRLLGAARVDAAERHFQASASLTLLGLCYANASECLPRALGVPDWDFLALTFGFVLGLCVLTFASGHLLGCLLGAGRDQRVALMFALGMSNNGTGLVLASVALASRPLAVLPVIAYNLAQHLVAGCAHAWLQEFRDSSKSYHASSLTLPKNSAEAPRSDFRRTKNRSE
jgi:BASS family bile acid:Na+ symporter